MVICLERGADLHMAQLMPLLLTVSCFNRIQIGFTFLVPADPGGPGQSAVKRLCVCLLINAFQCSIKRVQQLNKRNWILKKNAKHVKNVRTVSEAT